MKLNIAFWTLLLISNSQVEAQNTELYSIVDSIRTEVLKFETSNSSAGYGIIQVNDSMSLRIRDYVDPNPAPLIFVDGYFMKFEDLNDIGIINVLNIEILTDSSAYIIYGVQSKNGVILIETDNTKIIKRYYRKNN